MPPTSPISPRERVATALRHEQPDRTPVDFLATTDVWAKLIDQLKLEPVAEHLSEFMDPQREAVLRHLDGDLG